MTIWKSDHSDKIKLEFFQAVTLSVLLYGGTTWTLTKHLCCISGEKMTTLIYQNINSFLYYIIEMVVWESQETARIYTRLKYLFRKPFFFCVSSIRMIQGSLLTWGLLATGLAPNSVWLCWLLTDYSLCWQTDDSDHWDWKLLLSYIFWTPMHSSNAIHMAFPLSLVYLKTQLHCENTHLCGSLHELLTPHRELMCDRIEWEAGSQGKEKNTQQQPCG